jgi:hypothetical protein
MLKKIEALRNQPKHIRNRYAFWTALLITACIALVWTLSIPARFENEEVTVTQTNETPGVFSRSFGDMRDAVSTYIDTMRYRVEYKSDEVSESNSPYTLDLQALVASSTIFTEPETIVKISTSTHATSTPPTSATTTRFE